MKMEHWEDTVDYLLRDSDDVDTSILKDNLRKILCQTTILVLKSVQKDESSYESHIYQNIEVYRSLPLRARADGYV